MKQTDKAYVFAIIAVLLWSTVATAFKIALQELKVIDLVFYSTIISFVVLFIVLLISKKVQLLFNQSPKEILHSALLGLLNPVVYYLALFLAYDYLPAQEALALNYSWSVALALFAIPLLKQKLPLKKLLALLISFGGVLIIASHGNISNFSFVHPLGVSLALMSAVLWALYWIFNLKDKRENNIKLCTNFFFGAIYSAIIFIFFGSHVIPSFYAISASIYIGLFEMSITFMFWLAALKYAKSTASIASLIYLSPFISLVIISIVLKETIIPSTYIGLAFIMLGIILSKRKNSTKTNILTSEKKD